MKPLTPTPSKQPLPPATASAVEHADWLEWRALHDDERYVPWEVYRRDLGVGGVPEEEGETSSTGQHFEEVLNDIVAELRFREFGCGKSGYPFRVEQQGLHAEDQGASSTYTFLLSMSRRVQRKRPEKRLEKAFEELSAAALRAYLSSTLVECDCEVFGFPRRLLPRGFKSALDTVCVKLGEGGGAKDAPEVSDQKDAHLDIIAWMRFPDRRAGKLVVFGQCATGADWRGKIFELQPDKWCKLWLREPIFISPVPMFFLPHCVEERHWRRGSVYGGIVFDRCRLSWLVPKLPDALVKAYPGIVSIGNVRSKAA